VTAAFNLNLLVRVNRELDADFDLGRFAHRRSGMRRVPGRDAPRQPIAAARAGARGRLDLPLDAGEPIWTESSYKYRITISRRCSAAPAFA